MSKWKLVFTLETKDDLDKLSGGVKKRVIEKLNWLERNFDNLKPLPLSSEWKGFFKLRIGSWRIIYKIEWDK